MFSGMLNFIRNNKLVTLLIIIGSWVIYRMVTKDHVKVKVPDDGLGKDYLVDARKLVSWISPTVQVPFIGAVKVPKMANGDANDEKIVSLLRDYELRSFASLSEVYKQLSETSLYDDLKEVLSNSEFERIKDLFG